MIIDQIIQLKKEGGIDFGETYAEQLRHYKAALRNNCLEFISQRGSLVGFADWLRLPKPPSKRNFTSGDFAKYKGNYVYIISICAKTKEIFWKLIKSIRKKNKDAKFVCYHRKNGKLRVFEDIKEDSHV